MARRRSFYARDRNGKFARATGSRGVYRRKSSTGRKIAIAGAGAVAVGVAAIAVHQTYKAGQREGWEVGKRQGVYEAKPLRKAGKFTKGKKVDVSRNPYSAGHRPTRHGIKAGRSAATSGTRIRAGRVAVARTVGFSVQGRRVKR